MSLLNISNIDDKEAEALAHYRASQQQLPVPEEAASASPERDHVGQPMPRGSRLQDRGSAGAASTSVSYTVQPGDTLRGIAEWFYGDRSLWRDIYAATRSGIRDPQSIETGLELIIPRQGGSKPLA